MKNFIFLYRILCVGILVVFMHACTRAAPLPLAPDTPQWNEQNVLSEDQKNTIMQSARGQLLGCLQHLPHAPPDSGWESLSVLQNPFEFVVWNKGEIFFSNTYPSGSFTKNVANALSLTCKKMDNPVADSPDYQNMTLSFAIAHGFEKSSLRAIKHLPISRAQQLGLFGIYLANGKEHSFWHYPLQIIKQNLTVDKLFSSLCLDDFKKKNCEKENTTVYFFKAYQFFGRLDAEGFATLYRSAPHVGPHEVTLETLRTRLDLARQWLQNSLGEKGKMAYLYYPATGLYARNKDNMIRQFMTTYALLRLARYLNDANLLALAEKNLAYNMEHYARKEEDKKIAYIFHEKKAKLGASAFALMSLLASGSFPEKDKYVEYFANFIIGMQQPDGSFKTFYKPENRNDNQNFYPGEALLALMELYQTPTADKKRILKVASNAFDYYKIYFEKNKNPAFVPWHTLACARLYAVTKDKKYADFIFTMNDWLLQIQNTPENNLTKELDTLGRFYDPKQDHFGPPHASSTAVYTEGIIDALRLAITLQDKERINKYSSAIRWGLRSLLQLQFTPENSFFLAHPERLLGGIRTTETNLNIRVDNTQHTVMAILNALLDEKVRSEIFKVQTRCDVAGARCY